MSVDFCEFLWSFVVKQLCFGIAETRFSILHVLSKKPFTKICFCLTVALLLKTTFCYVHTASVRWLVAMDIMYFGEVLLAPNVCCFIFVYRLYVIYVITFYIIFYIFHYILYLMLCVLLCFYVLIPENHIKYYTYIYIYIYIYLSEGMYSRGI